MKKIFKRRENASNELKKKKQISQRAVYIAFSIVASIALWLYVAYVQDPDSSVTRYSIPIKFVGEEELLDHNLIVTSVNTETLTIKFTGKRNTVSKLNSANISAEVDYTEILSGGSPTAGVYQLSYDIDYGGASEAGIEVESASYRFVTVKVEKLVSVTVPIEPVYNIELVDGYTAEQPELSEANITVSGPQAEVLKVSYATIKVDLEEVAKSVSLTLDVVLMDENDNKIESDDLILSADQVTVTVPVLMVKDVPLVVNLLEGNSAKASNTTCTINPLTIKLSGDPEELNGLNQILLDTIDLNSFATGTTYTLPIVLPNNTNNLSGISTAEVKVELSGVSTRRLSTSNIQVKNLTDGYYVDIITQSLDITLRGPSSNSNLDKVKAENVRVVADLSDLNKTIGTFSVPAKVYVDGFNDIDAVGNDYKVTVVISETAP